jgi:hypothetical protein
MADNFAFTEGSGKTGAADDIGGVLYPRVKLDWGADGVANDVDTAAGKALPVQLRDTSGNEIGTSSHPVRVDPTGTTTQPVSAATLPLPSGAATDSSVQALVSATDFDAKVGSLTETAPASDTASSGLSGRLQRIAQRLTSLIALLPSALGAGGGLKIDGSGTSLPVTASAGTNLNTSALALETGGNLATIAGAVSSSKMATKAASGDFADGALATIGAKADAKNSATDTTSVSAMSVWKQISASVQAIATSLVGTLTVATHAVTQSGIWTMQPGNTANTTPWLFTPVPATSGGPSTSRIKSGASTNATSVKGSAGQVYGWYLYNNTSSAKFVKLYNKASSPTVGTDTPLFTIPLPANGGANVEFSLGIPFGTGIAYAITGAIADSDTTSTAADDVHGVLLYK